MRLVLVAALMLITLVLTVACSNSKTVYMEQNRKSEVNAMQSLKVSSPAFVNNTLLPRKYTCQGDNINPPLKIDGVPSTAYSLALIVDDPDAPVGTWDHWIVWNMPKVSEIKEGTLPQGAIEGTNSWGENTYGGPCPPSGTHRYVFKVYALDKKLDLDASANKKSVLEAIKGHVIASGEITGLYKKM